MEVAQRLADTLAGTGAVPILPHTCFLSTWTCWLSITWLTMQRYGIVGAISQTLQALINRTVTPTQWCARFRTYLLSCHINKPDPA